LSHTSSPFCSHYFEDAFPKLFDWAGLKPQPSQSQLPKQLELLHEPPAPWCFFILFYFGGRGRYWGFYLLSRGSTTWVMPPAPSWFLKLSVNISHKLHKLCVWVWYVCKCVCACECECVGCECLCKSS
jgi:hypothetical protein